MPHNGRSINLLLVEDNDDDYAMFDHFAKQSHELISDVSRADSLASAISHLENGDFDVIVLDLALKESRGIPTLTSVLEYCKQIPVVVLTDMDKSSIGYDAVQNGAQDFLPKSQLNKEYIEKSVRFAIERHERMEALQERNKEVVLALKEKEVLLKEVHHRVKNNLQVISSLLRLQSGGIEDEGVKIIFDNTRDRVEAMALVHENLYQSTSLSRINLSQYLDSLTNNLLRTYAVSEIDFKLDLESDKVVLPVDKAVPLALIMNEVVSNSLKHGFPNQKAGSISLNFHFDSAQTANIEVIDDGVGLPKNFNLENSESMGLVLIKVLSQQLGGSSNYYTKDEKTIFNLTFPIRDPEEEDEDHQLS